MATQLQSRRGTTAQMNAFTGAEGEIAVNTSTDTLHVHDGSTAGGHALAKADGSNIATYAGSFTTLAASGATTLSSTLAVTGAVTADGLTVDGDSNLNGVANVGGSTDLLYLSGKTGTHAYVSLGANNTAADFFIGADTAIPLIFRTAATERMRIDASGNLQLGTGTPAYLVGTSDIAQLSVNRVGTSGAITNTSRSAAFINVNGANGGSSIEFSTASANNTQPTERMRISSSGTVGIGMAPDANNVLSVKNTSGKVISLTNGVDADLYVDLTSGLTLVSPSTGTLAFGTGNTERMRIDASGNLLVGGTSLTAASSVGFTAAGQIRQVFASGVANDSLFGAISGVSNGFQIVQDASNNQSYKFHNGGTPSVTIDSSGNLLVGQTSVAKPTQSTEILTGAMRVNPTFRTAANAANLYWEPSTGVFWRSTSSLRYKQNVQDYTKGISDLMQIRPVTFNSNVNDTTRLFAGFIAEELHEQGLEEFVEYDAENRPDSVAYANLTSLLTKAIQEQQATIESQATAITDLTTRLTALENN